MAAPRILQVMAGADHGGAETYYISLVSALQRTGMQQHAVINPHDKRREALRAAGVPFTELPFTGTFDKQTKQGLKQIIENFKPDIVQTWMYQATRAMPRGDYIHIGWLRGYQHLEDYHRCDHLIGLTNGIVESIIAQGWPEERIHHIRAYADDTPAPPMPRTTYNTPENVPLILALGRLHWHKAFDSLLMALAQVPTAYLWLAGEGEQAEELKSFAEELGVMQRVRFLGWQEERAPLFAAADMCIVPSRHEPFGLVMVEAWAYGVPLIATKAAGPRATAQHEVDALMVPVDDVDAMARAIKRISAEPNLKATLIKNGRAHYERDYTLSAVVSRYQRFYREMLEIGPLASRSMPVALADKAKQFLRNFKKES